MNLKKQEIIWVTDKTTEFAEGFYRALEESDIQNKVKELITDEFFEYINNHCAEYFQDAIKEEAESLLRNILAGSEKEITRYITNKYKHDMLPEIRKHIFGNPELKKQLEYSLAYDDYKDQDWISAEAMKPSAKKVVRVLISKKDKSYYNPDTKTMLYYETTGYWWDDENKFYFDLPYTHFIQDEWEIVWWQYKTPHPTHKKVKNETTMKLTISGNSILRVYSTDKSEGADNVQYTEEEILKLHDQYLGLNKPELSIKLSK